MATGKKEKKAEVYERYPSSSVLVYNGTTILHFLAGGFGIWLAYGQSSWTGYTFGLLYLLLALAEMYVLMPLAVCPNCVYYRMRGSLCISGMNVFSRKIARAGRARDFSKRAEGIFCPNNLYLASLVVPIVAVIPPLIAGFSALLLALLLFLLALLAFRFFVIFPKIACLHCKAKHVCPQAGAMGVRDR
jgi:hypothetical protein